MVAAEKDLQNNKPAVVYLKDYQPTDFSISQIHLDFDLYQDQTIVTSTIEFTRNPNAITQSSELHLDGEELELISIKINGDHLEKNRYTTHDDGLIIYDVSDQFALEIVVKIHPELNKQLSGLYLSNNNFCTQCEPEGFRRIAYFYDRPDVLSHFITTITADQDKYPQLLANGNLVESKQLPDNRHWVKWHDPSLKPCYLFALVAGNFDIIEDNFTTMSGRNVALNLYLEKGYKEQGHYAMGALKRSMQWDEEKFHREYDLDVYMIVAVSDFNMGAMENKGLNIFNAKYVLADEASATDADFMNVERVIGHEYFHNWSGNRITCRDWFQITLKKGLTVLREQLFCEDMTGRAHVRIQTANTIRNIQFAQDAGPMSHPIRPDQYVEINNFYTVTVYEKGAEVIRMVRTFIGNEAFQTAMDHYFSRFDGQAVTTENFIEAMTESSGLDLTQFLRWYSQAGTPTIKVSTNYNADAATLSLTLEQHIKGCNDLLQAPLAMPIALGFIDDKGKVIAPELAIDDQQYQTFNDNNTCVLNFKDHTQIFTFINITSNPTISMLRDFSAPVIIDYHQTNEELLRLMTHDSDAFAGWDATQKFFTRIILAAAKQPSTAIIDATALNALKTCLMNNDDKGILASLLTLPAASYILDQMEIKDIQTVYDNRSKLKQTIALALFDEFVSIYSELDEYDYEMKKSSIANRQLKNTILSYLVASNEPDMSQLAYKQATTANNMTDTMGALCALNQFQSPLRNQALDHFHKQWQHNPLVLDKWLQLEASLPTESNIERIKVLMESKEFDLFNPNKARALLGALSSNLICFHQPNGAGYQLLADQVLKLDPHNRLTAARLCEPLIRFSGMDAAHTLLMKQQLQRILDTPNLSKDTHEIAAKALQ